MAKKALIGGFSTLIVGIILCITSIVYYFQNYYDILLGFTNAMKGASTVLQLYEQPIFAQITFLSGLLLVVSSFGYFINRKWSFIVGIIGAVIGLWSTWMLAMFPLMVSLSPVHFPNFFLVAAIFVVLLVLEKTPLKIMLTSFLFGVAFVMTFMNGNASLQKIIGTGLLMKKTATAPIPHIAFAKMNGNPGMMYDLIQTINWVGAITLAVICVAVLYRKDWVLPVGLVATLISIIAGTPVAYVDTVITKAGESLSMFSYGPIASVVILIALIVFREKLWSEEKLFAKKAEKVSSKA